VLKTGVVAIARSIDERSAPLVARALAAGGVTAFEITLNEPTGGALAAVSAAASAGTGMAIGSGTVLTIDSAAAAVAAGATFLVTPHTDPSLIAWACERSIPILAGALSPTEVLAAWRAGASAVKLFPASWNGVAYLRDLRAPFPEIPFVPTGGISLHTAGAFVAAGAVAVGVGGWLMGDGAPVGIESRARELVSAVAEARSKWPS